MKHSINRPALIHSARSEGLPDLHCIPHSDMPAELIESAVTSEGVTWHGTWQLLRTLSKGLTMLGETDAA